jgi:hypothetical protein
VAEGVGMNTFELELLAVYDEDDVAAAVVDFVRHRGRLPRYSELITGRHLDMPNGAAAGH